MYSLRLKISISISRTRTWFFFWLPGFSTFFCPSFFHTQFFSCPVCQFPARACCFFWLPSFGLSSFFRFFGPVFSRDFWAVQFFFHRCFFAIRFFFKGWFFLRVVFSRSVFYVESPSDEAQIELNTNTWLRNYKGQIESETIRWNAHSPTIEITYRIT